MFSDRQALLDAVRANPDDDTPRLVYADWLDEFAGSLPADEREPVAGQAEYLRLHARLAAIPEGLVDHIALKAQAAELEGRHRAVLLAAVPAFARGWVRFDRGLPTHLDLTARLLLRHGKRLRREVPYTFLRLRNCKGVLEEIVNAGLLEGVRGLDISFNSLTDGELVYLFRSPGLANLRYLELAHIRFGPQAAEALATSRSLAGLRHLNVWWCLPDVGRALAAPGCTLTNLTRLQIGNTDLGPDEVAALVAAPATAGLRDVEFSYNRFGPDAAGSIAAAPGLARLRRLSMWGCHIGDVGLTALAGSPHLRSLEYLGLHDNEIGRAGAAALGRSPVAGPLRTLELSDNPIGDGMIALVSGGQLASLERLNLSAGYRGGSDLTTAGVEALARSPVLASLRDLNFYGHEGFGPAAGEALAGSPAVARLERLDLGRCNLGPPGGAAIARSPHFARLRYLRLSRNRIGSAGGLAIATAPWLATIRSLHLDDNGLGQQAVTALLAAPQLDAVELLSLSGNRLGADTRQQFKARFGKRVHV